MGKYEWDAEDKDRKFIGDCPLCGRPMVEGPSVNEHHLVPKSRKGRETVTIHRICHSKIHSLFTERELALHYNTPEKLQAHPEIERFIKWVSKKDPEYKDRNRTSKTKGRRRR